MILGAGETSELTAGALSARGVRSIFVANRSHERAVTLAEKMKGKAIHFEDWPNQFTTSTFSSARRRRRTMCSRRRSSRRSCARARTVRSSSIDLAVPARHRARGE